MKKVIFLSIIGLLSFALGTAGIYFAMPSIFPEKIDSARVHLDSLELASAIGQLLVPAVAQPDSLPDSVRPDSLLPDSSHAPDSLLLTSALPRPQDIIQELRDSLYIANEIIRHLTADTSSLSARLANLEEDLQSLESQDAEASALSKSLSKLEDKQLSQILAGLHLSVIETLYEKSTSRERTRLLQSMRPGQAARFVRVLMDGPAPALEVASDDLPPAGDQPQNGGQAQPGDMSPSAPDGTTNQ